MNDNPLRKLSFQDSIQAAHTNLKEIKTRWDQLMGHLGKNVASAITVTSNTNDIGSLQSEIAAIQSEIATLQSVSTQRTFSFFIG